MLLHSNFLIFYLFLIYTGTYFFGTITFCFFFSLNFTFFLNPPFPLIIIIILYKTIVFFISVGRYKRRRKNLVWTKLTQHQRKIFPSRLENSKEEKVIFAIMYGTVQLHVRIGPVRYRPKNVAIYFLQPENVQMLSSYTVIAYNR